jgi:hypothetical protein
MFLMQDLILSLGDDLLPEVATVNNLILKSLEYIRQPLVCRWKIIPKIFKKCAKIRYYLNFF